MKKVLSLLLVGIFSVVSFAQATDYTRHVNPFIGTGGHGHTFPGATVPFGMVQLSPDTRIDNWDGSSGYHYSDDIIYGFSHTHLSGTGIPDGCDILFMPILETDIEAQAGDKSKNGYASRFSHANEKAEPGYYSVHLDDDDILAELTATTRVGLHRYTFPKSDDIKVMLDLKWRDRVIDSEVRAIGKNRIEGFRRSNSWAKDQTVYFVAEFSQSFKNAIFGSGNKFNSLGSKGSDVKGLFFFGPSKQNQQVLVKVAISYVSIEGARKNLEAELPHWDFDKVRADAKAAWNKELSKIEVSGGTPEQTTNFYTALYHTMIQPNVFNDADGRYKGHDGKIHQLSGFLNRRDAETQRGKGKTTKRLENSPSPRLGGEESAQYTVFSLWDTFRAAHPLYTIIDQKRTVDFINTFIRIYEHGGRLPVWELWGEETDTMIGYHAVSVIADAMAKNIKGFDYEKAYAAAKHSAELDHFGLAAYKKRGYISAEDENEGVSKTLEYAYNDWCLTSIGATLYNRRSLNKIGSGPNDAEYLKALETDIERYKRRSGNFENLFDPETRFFRPKQNGGFVKPFVPQEVTFHFTEGNSWQYSFFVPHDVSRLMELMGGTAKFTEKLDELFTTDAKLSGREQPDITGLMGQYAHGNEPSHHIAYLYNYAGRPSKTQARVRRIMDEFYKPTPDGLIGNEDCGQMSAWYVLSASGFYPVLPGDGRYDLGSPIFKEVTYRLENGKKFTVRAPKVSASNIYIKSAKWNGRPHEASYITHDHITGGGVLELEMSDTPNDKAFTASSSASVFLGRAAVPAIDGLRVFDDKAEISMRSPTKNVKIFYTVDGSTPTRTSKIYSQPLSLNATTTVRAFTVGSSGDESLVVESTFQKRLNNWKVVRNSGYNTQYTGGGDEAVIDGLRGTANYTSGEWQGYWGKPFEAVIDLRRETEIREVGGGFLQSARAWIWMPDRIEFETSSDGTNFSKIAEFKPSFSQTDMNTAVKDFVQQITPTKARYIRVRAYNFGKIPVWHPGAGGDPWIFVDEVIIK